MRLRCHCAQHAVDHAGVVGVHGHGDAVPGAAGPHRVQRLKTAHVRAQQHGAPAAGHGGVHQGFAAHVQVKTRQLAARQVDPVKHRGGKGKHVAISIAPAGCAAHRAAQIASGVRLRTRCKEQEVKRDGMQHPARHGAATAHCDPGHQAQGKLVATLGVAGPLRVGRQR